MKQSPHPSSIFDPAPDADPESRILYTAKQRLLVSGLSAFTMDDLADDLGMSKKTIYAHFPSKESIALAIIDRIGRFVSEGRERILSDTTLNCPQKLHAAISMVGMVLSKVSPAMLADLKRNAPLVYQKLDDMRRKNIPALFGRVVRDGIAEGAIRSDVDPSFAAEFWFQAIRGLIDPDVLERIGMTPKQALDSAVSLYFQGLLTPRGLEQYRQHIEATRRETVV